ncbi:MAG TPA: hypothetical protein VJ508_01155, partial [Saprospiraceae bacterium]|nr:hypothetical protein [Saprospiraceae bacterium]
MSQAPANSIRLFRFLFSAFLFLSFGNFLVAQLPTVVHSQPNQRGNGLLFSIAWSASDEQQWHQDNDDRLDIMGLKADIASSSLSADVKGSQSFQFTFAKEGTIECLLAVEDIHPEESLMLRDVQSGNIIFDIGHIQNQTILTPAFNPKETEFVLSVPEGKHAQSRFKVRIIYFSPSSSSRRLDIGFGTAMPCHPNAACKTDSLYRLISNSDVRIRLVHDEGIGWCSGSLINNVRQDKTPYLLTAYHCQYNYHPQYANWRFDFEYASTTCTNPPTE